MRMLRMLRIWSRFEGGNMSRGMVEENVETWKQWGRDICDI